MKALPPKARSFVLKIASRCNLNCSYCYVYNKEDTTWRERPKFMAPGTVQAILGRISSYAEKVGLSAVTITFHGGEPTLYGAERFSRLCDDIRIALPNTHVNFSMQTNGTLINERWASVLAEQRVSVGVSIDGPRDVHDANRVDHLGKGSYDRLIKGITSLKAVGIEPVALCVLPIGANPERVHSTMSRIGFSAVDYLFPDMGHDEHEETIRIHGETPVAEFLTPLLKLWLDDSSDAPVVRVFEQMAKLVLGGRSDRDTFGGGPQPYVFFETDGSIEGLDVLRLCGNGIASANLNAHRNEIEDYISSDKLPAIAFRGEIAPPENCSGCAELDTCSGGYLPHRYRLVAEGHPVDCFDNPSVWCADIKSLFAQIREALDVQPEETLRRTKALEAVAEKSCLV